MSELSVEQQLRQLRSEVYKHQSHNEETLKGIKVSLQELTEALMGDTRTDKDSIRGRLGAVERNTLSIQHDMSVLTKEMIAASRARERVRGEINQLKGEYQKMFDRFDRQKEHNGRQDEDIKHHRKWLIGITVAIVLLAILVCIGIVISAFQYGWL